MDKRATTQDVNAELDAEYDSLIARFRNDLSDNVLAYLQKDAVRKKWKSLISLNCDYCSPSEQYMTAFINIIPDNL